MKHWPVKNSYSKKAPTKGESGSFWQDRKGTFHCGVDIYAPPGSSVTAIESGEIIDFGIATSPEEVPYWNLTYYIIVKADSGIFCKYSEITDVVVKKGDRIKAGQQIAKVARILNKSRIGKDSPVYIQELIKKGSDSMLHFELYEKKPLMVYGNWKKEEIPEGLLDPTDYLNSVEF